MDTKRGIVLLVEDNPDDAMLIQVAFRKVGLEDKLMIVSDGGQAIDYLRGDGPYTDREKFPVPVVLLLDLRMPRVDGFEVIRWVRNDSALRQLPITVFTGSDYPKDAVRAYQLGANSLVVKPLRIDELYVSVREIAEFWLGCCELPQVNADSLG